MKNILLLLGTIALIGLVWLGYFSYNNLRGVGPVIKPPVSDISTRLDETSSLAGNNTGFPLQLPEGFSISVVAKELEGPRVLRFDPSGRLLVSQPGQGTIVALLNGSQTVVADGLNNPHGIAFHNGKLYIAETDQVAVYDYDAATAKATNKKKIVDLPGGGNHYSRTIDFGPDGKLYISVGSSCNVCVEKDTRRAKILVAGADGSDVKPFASGLRNAVFFTWSPFDRKMWATNMGRDLIGDDIPPETVNIVNQGDNFGWPYCYGRRIHDRAFDASQKAADFCKTTQVPHIEYQAHAAPLGLAFIPNSWPGEYAGDLLVAFHGSWNRTAPVGYKVVRFKLDAKGAYQGTEDFISGWLPPSGGREGVLGRPVDLLFDDTGSLFISDDKADVVYRVTYSSKR